MPQCRGRPCGSVDLHEGEFDEQWRCTKSALPGSRFCKGHRAAEIGGVITVVILAILSIAMFLVLL